MKIKHKRQSADLADGKEIKCFFFSSSKNIVNMNFESKKN